MIYQETIEVFTIPFHRHDQDESRLWDYQYESKPVLSVNDMPVTIRLCVGRRHSETDLAWNGRLFVGPDCIFVDALEYYHPEEAVSRCLKDLANEDTMQRATFYSTRKKEERS